MYIENAVIRNRIDRRLARSPDCLVEARNASVCFNLTRERVESLKEFALRSLKNRMCYEEFHALSDISFTLKRGESLGVIGPNGAGKSTLMRLLAGVLRPTSGSLDVFGTTAPLIALGNGFDYELTGNENIYLNGAALGYSNEFMRAHRDEILDFAELYDFADVPIKNYSSGMLMRLGFSIATIVQPDLLIADELLTVGDDKFHAKCEKRILTMLDCGMSAVIVSHSLEQVKKMCGQALLLDRGRMVGYGRVFKSV